MIFCLTYTLAFQLIIPRQFDFLSPSYFTCRCFYSSISFSHHCESSFPILRAQIHLLTFAYLSTTCEVRTALFETDLRIHIGSFNLRASLLCSSFCGPSALFSLSIRFVISSLHVDQMLSVGFLQTKEENETTNGAGYMVVHVKLINRISTRSL